MSSARADKIDGAIATAIAVSLAVVYWMLRCPTFGPGDSPQHVLSAVTWGVSAAPGYPLYVILGKLFSLAPFGAAASNVNGLSGILHAITAALFYLLLRNQGVGLVSALLASALMSFSRLFWYYSEMAEVRALNDFLAVGCAITMALWLRDRNPASLIGLALFLGFGLGHHPTFILILPAIVFALWMKSAWPPKRVMLPPPIWPGGLGLSREMFLLDLAWCMLFACGVPYFMLWVHLNSTAPAPVWNPAETKTALDVWHLFTRQSVGGPLRMVVGTGVFGFGSFDGPRFLQHMAWFFTACWTDLTPAGLILGALGAHALWKKDRETLVFWSLWVFVTAFVFISISSQQLILCDAQYVRGMVARFYLLPYIGLFAFAGFGADVLLKKIRPAFGYALLAAAIIIPAVARPMDMRNHNLLMDYCQLMLKSTGPKDMIVLAPDDTILGMSYLELAENATGDRVLLVPSLFAYPPYIRRLHARHPDLALPLEKRELSTDWSLWLKMNPGRRLFSEAVNRDTLLDRFPNSEPHGVLGEVLLKPRKSSPAADAKEFLAMTPDDFITRWNVMDFTQEVYLTRTYQMLLEWYGDRLGPKDDEIALKLKARLEAL